MLRKRATLLLLVVFCLPAGTVAAQSQALIASIDRHHQVCEGGWLPGRRRRDQGRSEEHLADA